MPQRTSYKHGEFSWVDLNAHDMDAAGKFYGDLFGWKTVMMDTQGGPPYAQFEQGDLVIGGLGQMSDEMKAQGIPPLWNNYVNVDDAEATASKAQQLGGQVIVPVMQVMDAGWLAYLQDPTGAVFAIWQKNHSAGATIRNEPNAFGWNELATRDIEAAKTFYGELFGWEFEENTMSPAKYYICNVDGENAGGLMEMTEEWGEIPPHWSVYFCVADATATANKLTELGGTVRVPPFDTHVGQIAILADAQGAGFNIIQLKEPA